MAREGICCVKEGLMSFTMQSLGDGLLAFQDVGMIQKNNELPSVL